MFKLPKRKKLLAVVEESHEISSALIKKITFYLLELTIKKTILIYLRHLG